MEKPRVYDSLKCRLTYFFFICCKYAIVTLERKDEYAVSGPAGVFLSSCGRSLRSEGSRRIQKQKNATLRANTTAADPIIQPSLATISKSRRLITPSSDGDSDSLLENSE